MRLIDADYLIEDRVSNDPVVIAAKCAPTIDAIPVEWLRKKREEAIWQFAGAFDWMISEWQKEQEAKHESEV